MENNEIGSRRWIKKSPSPITLKDKVIQKCLSEIKNKRRALIEKNRGNVEERNKLMKSFVSEMYNETKSSFNGYQQVTTVFDDYSENLEQYDELAQIQDAIEFELQRQQELDDELLEFIDGEDFAQISLYDEGEEEQVVCPVCR